MRPSTSGRALRAVRAVAVLLLLTSIAFSQIRSGTILGVVLDPTGAPVVDAEVRVIETQTNAVQVLSTNSAGEYSAPYLPVGSYTVTVRRARLQTGDPHRNRV